MELLRRLLQVIHHAQTQSLSILPVSDHGMTGWSGFAHTSPRGVTRGACRRRRKDHVLKRHRVHVMQTAERRQHAARTEQFERAQVNFIVAGAARPAPRRDARERRRVQYDEVEFGNNFLMRFDGRLGLSQSNTFTASNEQRSASPLAAALRFEASIASALWSSKCKRAPPPRAPRAGRTTEELKQSSTVSHFA